MQKIRRKRSRSVGYWCINVNWLIFVIFYVSQKLFVGFHDFSFNNSDAPQLRAYSCLCVHIQVMIYVLCEWYGVWQSFFSFFLSLLINANRKIISNIKNLVHEIHKTLKISQKGEHVRIWQPSHRQLLAKCRQMISITYWLRIPMSGDLKMCS